MPTNFDSMRELHPLAATSVATLADYLAWYYDQVGCRSCPLVGECDDVYLCRWRLEHWLCAEVEDQA